MRRNAPTCSYCRAPLPLQQAAEIVKCQYCGTNNRIHTQREHVAPPTDARPARASLSLDAKIALGVFALTVLGGFAFAAVQGTSRGSPASGSSSATSSLTPPTPSTSPEAKALQDERTLRPLGIDWFDEDEFVIEGYAELTGRVRVASDGYYTLLLNNFPEGTRWKVGDREGRVGDTILPTYVKVSQVQEQFGAAPVDDFGALKLGSEPSLALIVPLVGTAETVLPKVSAEFVIRDVIDTLENGRPLRFADEPEPRESTSILFRHSLEHEVFGPAETLAEIDFVAFVARIPEVKGEVVCSGYKDSDGDPRPDLTIRLKDHRVSVFARRTGELVHERIFPPRDECPTYRFDNDSVRDSYQPTDEIRGWLRSLR